PLRMPSALAPFFVWLMSPLIAHRLSRPPAGRRGIGDGDRATLRQVARITWRYFEAYVGEESHGLAPDNVQEVPSPQVAYRTSPTNIGLGMLATLAAYDLGYV